MNGLVGSTHTPANIFPTMVAIGASTGGPKAVATILSVLPADIEAVFVVLIHVGAKFAPRMGAWLDLQTDLPVHLVKAGVRPKLGSAYFPDGLGHLVLSSARTLNYSAQPADLAYRPSIDTFFCSVVKNWVGPTIGVLLTGMGRDGAEGLLALRQIGAYTIAQDEASSVVYSMPKVAREIDATTQVLPLEQIAGAISMRVPRLAPAPAAALKAQ